MTFIEDLFFQRNIIINVWTLSRRTPVILLCNVAFKRKTAPELQTTTITLEENIKTAAKKIKII